VFVRRLTVPLKFFDQHPLTRDRKIAAIARFVRWQISSRIRSGSVVHEWIDGSKFYVRAGETGLTQNIYTGLQEFDDMGFLLHFVRGGDTFVDVGSNVGSYTILACAARGARGYAIEPVPSTYERLLNNMRLNGIDSRVVCLNIGIGSKRGRIQFTGGNDTTNHALPPGSSDETSIAVEVHPLDEVLDGESPTLMKVDVEGYETLLVEGAQQTLKKDSLQAVIMELNGSGSRYGWDESQIVEKMIAFGLNPYAYDPFHRTLRCLDGNKSPGGNTLFLRDEAFVLERVKAAPPVTVLGRQF